MTELAAIIRAEIQRLGPMPFDRYMELALYHPVHGYYRRARARARTGRQGDFFTSVSVGPLFGRLLARQFLEMWQRLDRPARFSIIEQGGEDGRLACDILTWCRDEAPGFFDSIDYIFIEQSPHLHAFQQGTIEARSLREKVRWLASPSLAGEQELEGVFFSNELVDAFPVKLITRTENMWLERRVLLGPGDDFAWTESKIEEDELAGAIAVRPLLNIEGYTTEANLRAPSWMQAVARAIRRGYVLTIDYGFPDSIYYAPFRTGGTLTAFRQHRRSGEVLRDPGDQDITSHVDFTALAIAGESAGLATLGFVDQQHFLMGIAHGELSGNSVGKTGIAENPRAWNSLTNPNFLGSRFQVLLQARTAPGDLAGLRYNRPPAAVGPS